MSGYIEHVIAVQDDNGEVKGRLVQWVMAIYRVLTEEQQAAVRADLLRMNGTDMNKEK